MNYWAIRLLAAIQKLIAFIFAVAACGWFIFGLTVLNALTDLAAQRGVLFDGGAVAVGLVLFFALAGALVWCLGIYAFAQFLELQLAMYDELRAIRRELRRAAPPPQSDPY